MRDKYFYEVMFDDTSIDVSKEVGLVWSIAVSYTHLYKVAIRIIFSYLVLTSSLGWLIIKIRTNNSRIGNKEVIHMEKKVYVELPPFTGRNVPITEIAAAMHKDAQYVRIGLQQGILKFGYAIKLENSNEYNYYCPDRKVWEEIGYFQPETA